MRAGTPNAPRSGETEREFLSAGDPDSTGKIRRLAVVSALPDPPTPMSECTRVECLIFDEPPE